MQCECNSFSLVLLPTIRQEISSCNLGIAIVGLYFILEFGSFQGLYGPVVNMLKLPTIVAGSSVLYALYLFFSGHWQAGKKTILFYCLCLYVITMSYFMTTHSIVFENNLKLFLVYLSNYIVLAYSVKTVTELVFILDIWLASVAYTCLHGILQGGLVWSSIWVSDENQFAVLCCTAIPFAYFLMGLYQSKMKKACYLICLVLYFTGVVFATSRGGFLACFVVLIGLWLSSDKKLRVVTMISCLAVLILSLAPPSFFDEFENISEDEQAGTAADRLYLWRLGMDMFRDHPLLGIGPFNYSEFIYPYDQKAEARDTTGGINWKGQKRVAHSTPVTLLAEFGLVGTLWFVLLQFALVRSWWTMKKKAKGSAPNCLSGDSFLFLMASAAIIGQLAFWAGSLFLTLTWFPFWYVLVAFSELATKCGLEAA